MTWNLTSLLLFPKAILRWLRGIGHFQLLTKQQRSGYTTCNKHWTTLEASTQIQESKWWISSGTSQHPTCFFVEIAFCAFTYFHIYRFSFHLTFLLNLVRHTAYFLVAGNEMTKQGQGVPCKHATSNPAP